MLKGIDLSEFQGKPDFDSLKKSVDFAVIRAGFGTARQDYQFSRNNREVCRVNLPHGFYWYAYPNNNTPEAEANYFLGTVGALADGEFLALDFEENYADPVGWCKRFLDHVSASLNGYKPLLYINLALVQSHDWSPVFDAGYGLWLAFWDFRWNADCPKTPWSVVALRQYSDKEQVGGVVGNVDGDVFYGDRNQLHAYGFHPPIPAPPPVPVPPPASQPPVTTTIPTPEPNPVPLPPVTPPPAPQPSPFIQWLISLLQKLNRR